MQKRHDFGLALGGVWEAKIFDFRSFFDVFLISFFKRGSECEKVDQKCEKNKLFRFLASGLRWSPGSWGKERIGERTLQIELRERTARKNVEIGQLWLLRANVTGVQHAVGTPSVAGGLKAPEGGHRRLPNFGKAFGVTKNNETPIPV